MLPLIHFVLLSYLPLAGMRTLSAPGFAVGCGQFLKVRRGALKRLRTEKSKTFPGKCVNTEISPLRYASVEMTI